jgi:O-succinylbenzoate synthase
VRKTLQYLNRAKELGLKVVISDTFHSGIGLSFLIRLASIVSDPVPMGFDTYSWLDDDILFDRLPVKDGCFELETVVNLCNKINFSKLEKVG